MDPILVGVLALVVVAVLAALLWPARAAVAPLPSRRAHPGRTLIDHIDEVGRDEAGLQLARRLGQIEADERIAKFARLAPTPPNP